MHQHFEPEDSPHRTPFRGGNAYWHYYYRGSADPEYRERLDALRWEQEQRPLFNPNDEIDEPLFYTRTRHALDFNCTKLHTITMQDAAFLRTLGIMWKVPNEPRTAE